MARELILSHAIYLDGQISRGIKRDFFDSSFRNGTATFFKNFMKFS